jgi:hypothetical protein
VELLLETILIFVLILIVTFLVYLELPRRHSSDRFLPIHHILVDLDVIDSLTQKLPEIKKPVHSLLFCSWFLIFRKSAILFYLIFVFVCGYRIRVQ